MLKRLLRRVVRLVVRCVPERALTVLLTESAAAYGTGHDARRALRFLFQLGDRIAHMQAQFAIAYEGGVHPKHRLTKYHDFFIQRVRPGESVLDIGCGNGWVAFDLAEQRGARVTAIDLNEENIRIAKQRYAHLNVTYVCGDVLEALPERRYDTIILSNVLEHLTDRVEFLRRVHATCMPHTWLIRVPRFDRDWRVPLMKEIGVDYRLDGTHCIEYSMESFQEEMRQAGLTIVESESRWGEIWCKLASDVKHETRENGADMSSSARHNGRCSA